ncbi:MAG TPA: hypothetical protein VHA12_00185 [Candidatus Nanoarchaeia archaeon]|nr:hypothetical protein [Candidatus Nanoarchaeia archaeon]
MTLNSTQNSIRTAFEIKLTGISEDSQEFTIYATDQFGIKKQILVTIEADGIINKGVSSITKLVKFGEFSGLKIPYIIIFFLVFFGIFNLMNYIALRKYQYKEIVSVVIGIIAGFGVLLYL